MWWSFRTPRALRAFSSPAGAVRLLPDRLRHGLHDRSRGITTCGRSRTRRVVAKMGPVLQRASMGNGARGLQCQRRRVDHFTHDQARSRAYAGVKTASPGSATEQRLCLRSRCGMAATRSSRSVSSGSPTRRQSRRGRQGVYFYLDTTPTHSYMKWLYKYPQRAYPYFDLVATNRRRSREESEYELLDTGIFAGDRYFDVVVEYGKAAPEDILVRIEITNRGPEASTLHVLPTLWFRNTWRYWPHMPTPSLRRLLSGADERVIVASHHELGERWLYVEPDAPLLFTDNETNNRRLFGTPNAGEFVKDGINDYVVHGGARASTRRPGTKSAADCAVTVAPGSTAVLRLRLSNRGSDRRVRPVRGFRRDVRRAPPGGGRVLHRDHAGLGERGRGGRHAAGPGRHAVDQAVLPSISRCGSRSTASVLQCARRRREERWLGTHGERRRDFDARQVGYPWYTAWDLAFQAVALSAVDLDFAKGQLEMMLREGYLHPTGQMPAYEWNFADVNPPVHAWATIFLYRMEQMRAGRGRHRVPEAVVSQAAHELRLVDQPERPARAERLRRRLSRSRQHRRLRPFGAAADRRVSRAGGRDRLDGALLPEHARDRRGDRGRRPDVRNDRGQVRRSFSRHRERAEPARARRHVGRARRLLLRRAPLAGPPRRTSEGAIGRGTAADLRDDGRRAVATGARAATGGALRAAAAAHAGAAARHSSDRRRTLRVRRPRDRGRRQPRPPAPGPRADARRDASSSARSASGRSRARTGPTRSSSACTATNIA